MCRTRRSRRALSSGVALALALAAKPAGAEAPKEPVAAGPADQPQQTAPQPADAAVSSYPASFYAQFLPTTAVDMIDKTPGFVFDPGQSQRGLASGAGNVLIDGRRPTAKDDDLYSIVHRIPASQVARIEVIRGGAPGVDMQGQTVVANIVLRAGGGASGDVTVVGDYSPATGRFEPTVRLEGSRRAGGVAMEASFTAGGFTDNGYGPGPEITRAPDGSVLDRSRDGSRAGGVQATGTTGLEVPLFGGDLKLNTKLSGLRYTLYLDSVDQDPTLGSALERDLDHQETGELGATFTRKLGPDLELQEIFLQRLRGEDARAAYAAPGDVELFTEQDFSAESVLRSLATLTASRRLTLEAGVEGDDNIFSTRNRYIQNAALVPLPAADVRFVELRGEAFAKATYVATRKLTLEGGLRLEGSELSSRGDVAFDRALFYPKPRLVLSYSLTPATQARLRLEEEVGQLDFNDFVAASSLTAGEVYAGNPRLTPQRSAVVDLALERRFWSSGDLTVELRHAAITGVIDRAPILDPLGTYDEPANIGSGWETDLIVSLQAPLDRLGLKNVLVKANGTWRRSGVRDPTTLQRRPISDLNPRAGTLEISREFPRLRLTLGADADLGFLRPYYRFNEVEVDRFRTVGQIYGEWKPARKWAIRGEIDSIGADYRRTLSVWPDLRDRSAQLDTDQRDLRAGLLLHLRVRRDL